MSIPTNPHDVVFNQAAAAVAAEACETTAAALRRADTERQALADAARHRWSGGHRRSFDSAAATIDSDSARVGTHLARTAEAIRRAAHVARVDQRARESDR